MIIEEINKSYEYLKANIAGDIPKYALILGSGLSDVIENKEQEWDYSEIPSFSVSTAPEHSGKLIISHVGGVKVLVLQGRWHYYEGYDMKRITLPIRVISKLGIKDLFITNIAGGLNPNYEVNSFMAITDHINFFPDNPLRGKNLDDFGPRFPDMSKVYKTSYIDLAEKLASECSIVFHKGIYVGLQGPSLETVAEYEFLRNIGGDAVGMSTIPEAIVAKHSGMNIFALSFISNTCTSDSYTNDTIEDIFKNVKKSSKKLHTFFTHFIKAVSYKL